MSAQAETFLAIVDGTEESAKALRYAALRAHRTHAQLMLLHVMPPTQFMQWGGAQDAIEEEAEDMGRLLLEASADAAEKLTGKRPEVRLARGRAGDTVLEFVRKERSVRALVLAAAPKGKPGPLVEYFASERAGTFPCMIMLVPGGISDAEIDRLT